MVLNTDIQFTLGSLAEMLDVRLEGEPETQIKSLATLENATTGQLSFYHNKAYFQLLKTTHASAVILTDADADACNTNKLISSNPYVTYAKASQLFAPVLTELSGVHPSAIIAETAEVSDTAVIGPNVIIEDFAVVGSNVQIDANCVIGKNCVIGNASRLFPNVTLYPDSQLGSNVRIHAGTVIGSDGFGYAKKEDGQHLKIAQLGRVVIGSNVEIGASCTIDRGAIDDTEIADGVLIDNQVQIAHNVKIGKNTIICGCSAIAGSSSIGNDCIIAGAVGIVNHVNIVDGVTVTAMSLVSQSIKSPGIYSSGTGLSETAHWRKNIVRFRQLNEMAERIRELESSLKTK